MKFYVNVEKFVDALEPIIGIAVTKEGKALPWFGSIRLQIKTDQIVAIANSEKISAVSSITERDHSNLQYLCVDEGDITVDATKFIIPLTSFPPEEIVMIEDVGSQLVISYNTKAGAGSQSIPISRVEVEMPLVEKNANDTFKVNRMALLEGIKNVSWAIVSDHQLQHYMCVYFEASRSKLRFVAGSGARFAVKDIEGNNLSSAKKRRKLIFSACASKLWKTLSYSNSPDVLVQANSDQAVVSVRFDSTTLILSDPNTPTGYPPIENVVDNECSYKISSKLDDWKYVVLGLNATIVDEYDCCNAKVLANMVEGYFAIETIFGTKAKRTVKFTITKVVCPNLEESDMPWFGCNSKYLTEMYKKGSKGDEVVLEFNDQEQCEEKEKSKCPGVVLVRYPEKVNAVLGTKERFCMFFAISSRV